MQKEPIYNLLNHYEFLETKEQDQFSGMFGLLVCVGEFVVVRRFGNIELVTDHLESLDEYLYSFSHFYLRSSTPERYCIPKSNERVSDSDFPIFNEDFWDCECEDDFIHQKEMLSVCPKCGAEEENQPDSLALEVEILK